MDLVTIGDLNIDITLRVPRFPKEDDEIQISDIQRSLGGDATNIAVTAAKLGAKTALISCVGYDIENMQFLKKLTEQKINIEGTERSLTNETGFVISLVRSDGQRNLISYRGANQDLRIGAQQMSIIRQCRAVHISDPIAEVENWLIDLKMSGNQIISFDPGSITAARGLKTLKPILEKINILFINETETSLLIGKNDFTDSAKILLSYGPKFIVIKRGMDGCYIRTKDEEHWVQGYKVAAVDSTGAGDAFNAAFLTETLNERPMVEAADYANAVGAITVTKVGAQSGLIDRKQVIRFMQLTETY
jgi:ribokinase